MRLLLEYARERLAAVPVLAAGLLVVLAALAGRGWTGGEAAIVDVAAAFGLVIAFRIWDDLIDRGRDRVRHPARVAVRPAAGFPLAVCALMLAIGAALLVSLMRGPASLGVLAAYTAILGASYATRGPRSTAREWILLLKYGVFTLALIGVPAAFTTRGLLSAAAAFAAACVYERLHDAESPVFSLGGSR
jgi:4-hydroxybenzoate polyprenyltransferase